jgi:hypothetical protein
MGLPISVPKPPFRFCPFYRLTGNKASSDRAQVFADVPVSASAAFERLRHRSTVLNLHGESFGPQESNEGRRARGRPSLRPTRLSLWRRSPDPSHGDATGLQSSLNPRGRPRKDAKPE